MKRSSTAIRIYRILLWLYPASFRREYGALMLQAFRDLYQDADHSLALWLHILADTLGAASREHLTLWKRDWHMRDFTRFGWVFMLLPGLGVVLLYSSGTHHSGVLYIILGLWGIIGLILSRLGLMRPIPEWNLLGIGALMIPLCIFMFLCGMLPGLGPILWAVAFMRLRRYIPIPPVARWVICAMLVNTILWTILRDINHPDQILLTYLSDFSFTSTWSLMMLMIVLLAWRFGGQFGQRGILIVLFALGMIFDFADFSYFTWEFAGVIQLSGVIFPLLLCPICLLWLQTPRLRQWVTLALWALMLLIGALGSNLARADLPYENLASHLSRVTAIVPYFLSLWLAFQLFGKTPAEASITQDDAQPSTAKNYALEVKGR